MQFRIGQGVFAPRLLPSLLTLLMLPILLGLGSWQVHRLHWKTELLKTMDERIHDAPLEIPYVSVESADYRPAKASGTYQHDKVFYVFSTDITSGKGGYHLLTPLQLANGSELLVDRGWIPYELKDKSYAKPAGVVEVNGVMRIPSSPGLMQPTNNPGLGYWYSIDFAAMAKAHGVSGFLPYILEADETANEGGYPVGGQMRQTLPNNHLEYAITWYSFAGILLIIYLMSSWKRDVAD